MTIDVRVNAETPSVVIQELAKPLIVVAETEKSLIVPSQTVVYVEGGVGGSPGYTEVFASAASSWTVNHNLGRSCTLAVLTPGGAEVEAEVTHTSLNQTVVQFAVPFAGMVIVR